ncbi:MAG TPA: hypothetical protein DDY98_06240, partial [Ruminococcaceae bacterium]|nr:hypothetical protein [Oscillospiraceae bacterium]
MIYFKMFTAAFMALVTAIGAFFSGTPVVHEECMIAHRGYSGKYNENTATAFEKAYEHGSGGCETDVRVTKDGELVLSHNSDVVLKDGTTLAVADSTLAELTAQPLKRKAGKEYDKLCTFREYLEIMKKHNMICFIELKGEFTEEQIKKAFNLAAEVYSLDKCILQSFEMDNLVRAHELFPTLGIMLTYGEGDDYSKCLDYGFSIDAEYTTVDDKML